MTKFRGEKAIKKNSLIKKLERVVAMKKPFIVVLGKPGSGKSSVLRRTFAKVRDTAAFLDGDHDFEQTMHIVHESGFQKASYFYCPIPEELPAIVEEREESVIFIDTPRLNVELARKIADAAGDRAIVLAVTALNDQIPKDLEPFTSSVIVLQENKEEVTSAIVEALAIV